MKGRIAVVIPCYKVVDHIRDVIGAIPSLVDQIYCVDDNCPQGSGQFIKTSVIDPRVRVIFHETNQGVGGATLTGYRAALADELNIVVKLDGDGQMDPAQIELLVCPIIEGRADYSKGNRFFHVEDLTGMPVSRLIGNGILSFFSKLSSGYWRLFDPTNGYTAIHSAVLRQLPLDKISRDYFFESDMLFRLNIIGAVIVDIPMPARYGEERSNLRISRIVFAFANRHLVNLMKRIFYNYFLRDFSLASVQLIFGLGLFLFGSIFGLAKWIESAVTDVPATAGTVMLAALPFVIGLQLLLGFLSHDMGGIGNFPLQKRVSFGGKT